MKKPLLYNLEKEGIRCPCCQSTISKTNNIRRFIEQIKSLDYIPYYSLVENEKLIEIGESCYFREAKEYNSYVHPPKCRYAAYCEKQCLGFCKEIKVLWACDQCISNQKAVLANSLNEQNRRTGAPIFAFFDLEKNCINCDSKFVFKGSERQHWIEELHFFHLATKVHCDTCHALRISQKKLSYEIRKLRNNLDNNLGYKNTTIKISELYLAISNSEKAKGIVTKGIKYFRKMNELELAKKLEDYYKKMECQ